MTTERKLPGTLIFETVYGSHAHGTATPESDVDTRGVFQLPNDALLGLGRPTNTWEIKSIDSVYWEVGQFCRLLLKGNPNIVGMLYVDGYSEMTAAFAGLPQMRESLLTKAAYKAYSGWVHRELQDIGKLHKGHAKRLSHVPRLLWEMQDMVLEHSINVRLTGYRLQFVMDIKTGAKPYEAAMADVGNLLMDVEARIGDKAYDLPGPPTEKVEEWLLATRHLYG